MSMVHGVAVLSRDHADQSNPCFDIQSHDPIMAVLTNSVNSLMGTAGYMPWTRASTSTSSSTSTSLSKSAHAWPHPKLELSTGSRRRTSTAHARTAPLLTQSINPMHAARL